MSLLVSEFSPPPNNLPRDFQSWGKLMVTTFGNFSLIIRVII